MAADILIVDDEADIREIVAESCLMKAITPAWPAMLMRL